MEKPLFKIRMPRYIKKELQQAAKEHKMTMTNIVLEALEEKLKTLHRKKKSVK